jgi:TRAP-type C4-dicarboxylate transport system permease small subunit
MKKVPIIAFLLFLPIFALATNGATTTRSATDRIREIAAIIRTIAIACAVLMIVIGGFQWMTSAGDPGKISDAKDRIFAAILGLLIIAFAELIAVLVGGR